jgi:nucleoside-diphosphate-sugar epimerase
LRGRVYNIGIGKVYTWREIAEAIRELYPRAVLDLGPGPVVVRRSVLEQTLGRLDYSLANTVFGYAPKFGLREGIRHFAEWLEQRARKQRI